MCGIRPWSEERFSWASFPVAMTTAWLPPVDWSQSPLGIFLGAGAVDTVSTATPLAVLKQYGVSALTQQFGGMDAIYKNFFIGKMPGCIGETSALLILAGGLFLMIRGIITWHIPVSAIVSVAVLSWIFGGETWFSRPATGAGAFRRADVGCLLYVHRLT